MGAKRVVESASESAAAGNDISVKQNSKLSLESSSIIMHPTGFEECNDVNMYDVVITSPPFYDVEMYRNGKQSTDGQKTYKGWIETFYKIYLQKSFTALKPGGFLGVYIEDVREYTFEQDTVSIINALEGAKQLDTYWFKQNLLKRSGLRKYGTNRSMFCWTKI